MTKSQKIFALLAIGMVAVLAFVLIGATSTSAQGPGQDGTPYPCPWGNTDSYNPGSMMGGHRGHMTGGRGPGHMMGQPWGDGEMPCWGTDQEWSFEDMPCADVWDSTNWGTGSMMMHTWAPPADLAPAAETILSLEGAVEVAEAYIAAWDDDNLTLHEVMQFDNHFYAEAVEADTGQGAFEFLIDPTTGYVIPEPGPNMMWNLRYGMHNNGFGMMGRNNYPTNVGETAMTVSADEAMVYAQTYLDEAELNLSVDDEVMPFYGYYTLHTMQDGEVVGMLSVNGYTGQVWLHTWHGDFVAMIEHQE